MLALGLLFMIVAAAVTAGAIYDGGESAEFEVFGQTVGTTIGGIFVAGLATMLLFFVGVYLLMKSLARSRRKRLERKETKTRQKESVSKIEEERAQLRAENEALQERLASEHSTAASTEAARVDKPSDGTTGTTTGTTSGTTGVADSATERTTDTASERPTDTTSEHPTGRVEHRDTDLTAQQEATASGRHRDV